MPDTSLLPFFRPRGIAVLGASRETNKLGYMLSRNLVHSGYPGAIHFVNPRGGTLFDRQIYKNISDLPDPVDLALVLTPPAAVPDTLRACGQRGIKAAILLTGGFKETGPEGAALEEECLMIARSHGIRLIGPNCVGIVDTHLPLDTTFLQPPPPSAGDIAFLSHSGAIVAAIIDWFRGQGIGFSRLLSIGNQVDVTETDLLAPVANDPQTKVITLYMESVASGRKFVNEARKISQLKPLVALKVGRFESGRRAAASHTGALAGTDAAVDAAFRRAGVLRANTTEEMFQWAKALAWCPLPKGPNTVVLTNAGGPGVTAADMLESCGLSLAQLGEPTLQALKKILPPFASVRNPVDMIASATPDQYAQCLQIVLDDPATDMVMIITPPPPTSSAGQVAKQVIPIIQNTGKPVVVVLMGDMLIQEGVAHLRAMHVPEYRFPEQGASALASLYRRAQVIRTLTEEPVKPDHFSTQKVRGLLKSARSGEWLETTAAFEILQAYGIQALTTGLADSPARAVKIAEQAGYPVSTQGGFTRYHAQIGCGRRFTRYADKRTGQRGLPDRDRKCPPSLSGCQDRRRTHPAYASGWARNHPWRHPRPSIWSPGDVWLGRDRC